MSWTIIIFWFSLEMDRAPEGALLDLVSLIAVGKRKAKETPAQVDRVLCGCTTRITWLALDIEPSLSWLGSAH